MKFNSHGYIVIALAFVSLLAYHYYGKYTRQLDTAVQLQSELLEQQNEIVSQQERIKLLSELDNKHIKEFADAKSEIDGLRDDVAIGHRWLRIAATCNQGKAGSSSRVGHAGTPQFTETAQQDYYDLLGMMAENEQQTKYLQEYIKTQCVMNDSLKH
ncbi:peptidase [Photorhabdus luminescens]|uniref:Peptidase n=1 Tax=Photorhabdus akhurstii TaxID=171438 RepID=A0ABX8LW81_9GAMM|nr:lysis protein [Photorhabdus akhurstii]QXF34785.1 peptidase [Photorhabdus akhurstii]UJD76612.1 peptidase [Photorhabdus luminescens]